MAGKPAPRGKKVLVVDDDESICIFLKMVLEKEGFDVSVCYNGEEAVKAVNEEKVDLIVLDWMMPVLSGFEVLKLLQEGPHRAIPVIVITARVTDENTINMIKNEMNVADFVLKPIKTLPFVARIREILRTKLWKPKPPLR